MLGICITRDRANRRLSLDQHAAVLKLIGKAGMADCKPINTPVAVNMVFTKADCPVTDEETNSLAKEATWYRSILASCIYLVMWTRPDLAFAQSKLSKFMHNPAAKHIEALKRMVRYLKGTSTRCLLYDFGAAPPRKGVYGYYDASHADDLDTRRSTMAYIFFFEGCAISWHSKVHTFVTTSTNHSEYCASAKAAKEAKLLEKIFCALGHSQHVKPIDLFSDSKGAISMNYNPVHSNACKHGDLQDHYARELVDRGTITISFVPTDQMTADVFTKALAFIKFDGFVVVFMAAAPVVSA
jgi:hypothetical protein